MKTSTTLMVLALVSAAALATSGDDDDDDDDKEPQEPLPPPPVDEDLDDVDEEPELPDVDDPEEPSVDPDAPTIPIPTPYPPEGEPTPESEPAPSMPPNVVRLEDLDDFREWGVADAVEPDGSVGAKKRVVMLGYDEGWIGRIGTMSRVVNLANANPSLTFVLFTFQRSKELTGLPTTPLGYVATSVGPDGRARPSAIVGKKKTLGPISHGQWAELVRWAKDGPLDDDAELRLFESKAGVPYVVEVRKEKVGFVMAWRWKVWRENLGEDDDVTSTGTKPTKKQAIDAARSFIFNIGADGQAGPGLGLAG